MNKLILIFLIFVQVAIKAQTIHTLYIDSTHITSDWPTPPFPCPSDTSFTISDGDTLYFINKLSNTMFNVWFNDPHFTDAPTYSTSPTPTNDTITRIAVVNNSNYHLLGDNNSFIGSFSQVPDICLLKGSAEYGRKYFINYTVGIDDLLGNEVLIYPTPAENVLHIEGISEKGVKFSVLDLSGKILITGNVISNKIDIQKLPTGTYLLNLSNENHNRLYKFIKH